jgi:hypothetical protein
MAGHFRLPYIMVLRAFDWLACRQYAQRFSRLDPAKRKDYLSVWIHSTVGFKRDFIKLIRSCALLRFYDHPEIMASMEEFSTPPPPGRGA